MKQVVLASRPAGNPRVSDFRVEDAQVPRPADGEILVRTHWLSLDPYMRLGMDENPIGGSNGMTVGAPLVGGTVSEVIETRNPAFAIGDIVEGRTGWREFAAANPATVPLRKIEAGLGPSSLALGVVGMPGQTAHAAMIGVGRVAKGETVVISAAAGAVGSIAGQIGKILGARVVGIAGGPDKCAAVEALGFDVCVDYKAPEFAAKLAAACPAGIDVYLENVGGAVTEVVLPLANHGARIPVCGFISYYGVGEDGPGPDKLPAFMRLIMAKGLELKGFHGQSIAGPAALGQLAAWVRDGLIRPPETVVEGIENAPAAFAAIFNGNANVGKLIVRVSASG